LGDEEQRRARRRIGDREAPGPRTDDRGSGIFSSAEEEHLLE